MTGSLIKSKQKNFDLFFSKSAEIRISRNNSVRLHNFVRVCTLKFPHPQFRYYRRNQSEFPKESLSPSENIFEKFSRKFVSSSKIRNTKILQRTKHIVLQNFKVSKYSFHVAERRKKKRKKETREPRRRSQCISFLFPADTNLYVYILYIYETFTLLTGCLAWHSLISLSA